MSIAAGADGADASWKALATEAAVALGAAALFTLSCITIDVNPLERVGQISGLASLGLRFTISSIVLIAALAVISRRRADWFPTASRLGFAALSGLLSAFVAGSIIVALHGTRWGLNGGNGDSGDLIEWARGYVMYDDYPPLSVKVLRWYSDLFGFKIHYAVKHLQIAGTAVLGPAAYLSWRLVLRPGWALAVGVVATLPLLEAAPYKPFGAIVLMMLVPLLVRFIDELRRTTDRAPLAIARTGVGFGLVLGVLFLLYSGWFQWAAPGAIAAMLYVFPWRTGARNGLLLLGSTLAAFLAISGSYLAKVFFAGAFPDHYVYFDVLTEPAYVSMFRGDMPGQIPMWPPFGELAGVSVFTLLWIAGTGIAVALGRGKSIVIGAASIVAGSWLLRFWYAHSLWDTKLVQLYPRTTPVILYCLLILTGFAVYLIAERHRQSKPESPIHSASGVIGAVCALCLLFGSAASSIGNEYMPIDVFPYSPGRLAWTAHHAKQFFWGKKPP